MAKQWLLKLQRQDDDDQGYVLIRVTPRETDDLDLDFLATEGENVFKGKLRRNDLRDLRAKAYNGTEEEWEAILRYALLESKSSAISQEQKQSLEVGASRQDQMGKPTLSITFRNRIDDITQRIGAIDLSQTSKSIQLFDWAGLAVDRANVLESKLAALSDRTNGDKATIARLESQLADLVKVKADHEEQLLLKFTLLLNDKKAKIRDQQRLIQTATFDKGKGRELRALQKSGSSRNTTRRTGNALLWTRMTVREMKVRLLKRKKIEEARQRTKSRRWNLIDKLHLAQLRAMATMMEGHRSEQRSPVRGKHRQSLRKSLHLSLPAKLLHGLLLS